VTFTPKKEIMLRFSYSITRVLAIVGFCCGKQAGRLPCVAGRGPVWGGSGRVRGGGLAARRAWRTRFGGGFNLQVWRLAMGAQKESKYDIGRQSELTECSEFELHHHQDHPIPWASRQSSKFIRTLIPVSGALSIIENPYQWQEDN